MATVLQIITDAMRDGKIIGVGKEPKAAEADYGLRAFNQMLHAWEDEGINLAHADLVLTDSVDVPESHLEALRSNLLIRLRAFGAELTQLDYRMASDGYGMLLAYHLNLADLGTDNPLAGNNLAIEG